jgi:ribokinase
VPSRRSPRLTVVGSVNLDLIARVTRLPRAGETITGASFDRAPGGKGANQAVAAARLGADVRFLGCIGDDEFGRDAVRLLEDAGIPLDDLNVVDGPSGIALIVVADDGENQIVVAPNANALLAPEDIRVDGPVLCQLETPIGTVAEAARQADWFALNAAPAHGVDAALVAAADLVVVNRYELDTLGAVPRLTALTLGAEGAILLEDGQEVSRAAPPKVEAVDGTAAGDAFAACLVVSLLEERDREEALRRACAAGAIAASRFGAQPSLPTGDEVDAILRP